MSNPAHPNRLRYSPYFQNHNATEAARWIGRCVSSIRNGSVEAVDGQLQQLARALHIEQQGFEETIPEYAERIAARLTHLRDHALAIARCGDNEGPVL